VTTATPVRGDETWTDFYGKTVPGHLHRDHPEPPPNGAAIYIMAYCMAGTLCSPYLARRARSAWPAASRWISGRSPSWQSPLKKFDDGDGHAAMARSSARNTTRCDKELYGNERPAYLIEAGHERDPARRPAHRSMVSMAALNLAQTPSKDAAPFCTGYPRTKFPPGPTGSGSRVFLGNALVEGNLRPALLRPDLDGKPVRHEALDQAGVLIFGYRGTRDPIARRAPAYPANCGARSRKNVGSPAGGLNRLIEKNVGHIFVVSKVLPAPQYLTAASTTSSSQIDKTSNPPFLPLLQRGKEGDFLI